jgi:hypothetical protein
MLFVPISEDGQVYCNETDARKYADSIYLKEKSCDLTMNKVLRFQVIAAVKVFFHQYTFAIELCLNTEHLL